MYNVLMKNNLSKIRHPFQLQGSLTKPNYFEGWYFKQVHLEQDKTISFIFGISTGKHDPHSFVQVIQSNPLSTAYFKFPLEAFKVDGQGFILDKNRFGLNELEIHLHQEGLIIDGILYYSDHQILVNKIMMPNIMGPFAYIPDLECNHGVISMNHHVNGTLNINHHLYTFKQERGYIEKDWGRSFPKRYIWIQGNHFNDPKTSFMASIAHIPLLGLSFEGLICQLDTPHKRFRFATYTFSKMTSLRKTEDGFEFVLKKGSSSLKVIAHIPVSGELRSPHLGSMIKTIKEGLGGSIDLILTQKGQDDLILGSDHCGIEIEGYL
jgi:tocopherol cyclase